jgi:serralysin
MFTATTSVSPLVSQAVPTAVRAQGPAALMAGSRWASQDGSGPTFISYSFADAGSGFNSTASPFVASMSALSEADREITRKVLHSIEAVCNVEFVEVADTGAGHGVLRYAYSQQPTALGHAGYAFYPSSADVGGDIWIGKAQAAAEWSHYRPGLILHETLHALGLKHPFEGADTLASADNIIPTRP